VNTYQRPNTENNPSPQKHALPHGVSEGSGLALTLPNPNANLPEI